MTITVLVDSKPVEISDFHFSAGEMQVKILGDMNEASDVLIKANIHSEYDWVKTLMVLEAVSGNVKRICLEMPYLPYGRQDRACAKGEVFSLKVFAKSFEPYLNFVDTVITWDAHSPVASFLFEGYTQFCNIEVGHLLRWLNHKRNVVFHPDTVVIAPDKGAVERAELAKKAIGAASVKYATKVRNPENGHILRTDVEEGDYEGKDLLIVDDICDGGRTFIELAKVLRTFSPRSISLYVTHGIFSKGFEVFEDLIDHFYVANLVPDTFSLNLPENLTKLQD